MGVDPEGPQGVVKVEDEEFGEGKAVGEGFGGVGLVAQDCRGVAGRRGLFYCYFFDHCDSVEEEEWKME